MSVGELKAWLKANDIPDTFHTTENISATRLMEIHLAKREAQRDALLRCAEEGNLVLHNYHSEKAEPYYKKGAPVCIIDKPEDYRPGYCNLWRDLFYTGADNGVPTISVNSDGHILLWLHPYLDFSFRETDG